MAEDTKLVVNGIEQSSPCKKVKLPQHKTPEEITKLIQAKQKELGLQKE